MLSIKIGTEEFKLDVITVRKLNHTMQFKKKFDLMQSNGEEGAMIDSMIDYLVDIFSTRQGEKTTYAFDKDYVLDNMPLGDLQRCFQETITAVLEVFGGEAESKK